MMVSVCFASNVYEVGNDVELDSTIYWPSDYKISLLAFDDADSTMLEWIYDMLTDIWNDMRAGFEFVDEDIVAGNTLLSQINVSNTSIYNLLDGMDSTLDYVLQGVGQTNGYLAITNNKLADLIGTVGIGNSTLVRLETLFPNLFQLPASGWFLNYQGVLEQAPVPLSPWSYIANGFMGVNSSVLNTRDTVASLLDNYLVEPAGGQILWDNGERVTLGAGVSLSSILRVGLLGLDSGIDRLQNSISGSLTNHSYSGTSIDNSNESTSFSATGLGPMLNTWLGDIQNDLGVLSYVFASPQDLELKEKSSDNMTQIGDSLLSPDSASSVKVSDIAGISEASTAIKGFGDTGVSIGQAFAQLGDASLFRFFSAEAASDLDTSVSTYSRNASDRIVTNYYADSRDEFYSIINGGEE